MSDSRGWPLVLAGLLVLASAGCREGAAPDGARTTIPPRSPAPAAKASDSVQADWIRIDRWIYYNVPEFGRTIARGAAPEYIAEVEQRLGVTFPADFRASLAVHDGQGPSARSFFFDYPLWTLGEIQRVNTPSPDLDAEQRVQQEQALAAEIRGKTPEAYHARIKADARVNQRWIRFAGGADYLAIDLDPGPEGHLGQIVCAGPGVDTPRVVARSFGDLLHAMADLLESGACEIGEVDGQKVIRPKGGADPIALVEQYALRRN